MLLSLIIPTHKRAFEVEMLLKSISKQNFPKENLEILLISNLKDFSLRNRLPQWRKQFLKFKYKEVGLKGVNKARNMGIRFARGDILYFLDDDCVLFDKNHLHNLMEAHKNHPDVVGIGGPYKSQNILLGGDKFYHENTSSWICKFVQLDNKTSQLLGGNASYKRSVFDRGFYFNPYIIFGGSEESFNNSIKDLGLLFDKNLWVYHRPKVKGFVFIKKSFQQGRGSFKNRFQFKTLDFLKEEWAFLHGNHTSYYSLLYQFFFKMGYFWEYSSSRKKGFLFKTIRFIFILLKSRWYFFRQKVLLPLIGKLIVPIFGKLIVPIFYKSLWVYGKLIVPIFYKSLWVYGKLIVPIFYKSPPMKVYYFSRYQYYKRIKPIFKKKNIKKSSFIIKK
ncbi:MAG: glycosyltransferase [Bdellovibrionales bacterium]|nr:glycosyltransferase [Bdellovibrionales bacterium]